MKKRKAKQSKAKKVMHESISEWWKKSVDRRLLYDIMQGLKALCDKSVIHRGPESMVSGTVSLIVIKALIRYRIFKNWNSLPRDIY